MRGVGTIFYRQPFHAGLVQGGTVYIAHPARSSVAGGTLFPAFISVPLCAWFLCWKWRAFLPCNPGFITLASAYISGALDRWRLCGLPPLKLPLAFILNRWLPPVRMISNFYHASVDLPLANLDSTTLWRPCFPSCRRRRGRRRLLSTLPWPSVSPTTSGGDFFVDQTHLRGVATTNMAG